MAISNRAALRIVVCILGPILCGTAAGVGIGVKGIAVPSQFLADIADDHAIDTGALHGVDFNFARGSRSRPGTAPFCITQAL